MAELRVSDADRDRVARELREHFAAGRLTDDELGERLEAAYSARTQAELDALKTDLPPLPLSPGERKAAIAERRAQLRRRLLQEAGGSLTPFVICVVIWAATGAGSFWPVFVLIPFVITIVRNGWLLYGPDPDLDRVERQLDRERRRNELRDELRGQARHHAHHHRHRRH